MKRVRGVNSTWNIRVFYLVDVHGMFEDLEFGALLYTFSLLHMGLNGVDNAKLTFNNVRVPR